MQIWIDFVDGEYHFSEVSQDAARVLRHTGPVVEVPDEHVALWRAVMAAYSVMQGQLRDLDNAWHDER